MFSTCPQRHLTPLGLDSVLLSPLTRRLLVLLPVGLVGVSNLRHERIVGVGVSQHGADRQEDWMIISIQSMFLFWDGQTRVAAAAAALTFADGQGWRPLVAQDVEADATIAVDVGVVDAGAEVDLGGLEGVVCGEVDGEEEYTTGVWGV